jgi:hypothetical protein
MLLVKRYPGGWQCRLMAPSCHTGASGNGSEETPFVAFARPFRKVRYLRTADGRNRHRSVARSVQKLWSGLAL